MLSARFALPVVFTEHALRRMADRAISDALVLDIIDTGTVKPADETHLWIYKHLDERHDKCCVWPPSSKMFWS